MSNLDGYILHGVFYTTSYMLNMKHCHPIKAQKQIGSGIKRWQELMMKQEQQDNKIEIKSKL